MSYIAPIDEKELPEFDFIFKNAAKMLGETPNSMLVMGHKPGLLGAFSLLAGTVMHRLHGQPMSLKTLRFFFHFLKEARKSDPENEISRDTAQLIAHVSSLSAGCRYCQAHTADAAALLDVPGDKIEALVKFESSPLFSEGEKAALSLAWAASRVPNEAGKEHFDALRKHFNEKQIIDIVAVIALFGFLNRWNDTMATALEDHPRRYAEEHLAAAGWEVGKHA